MRFHHKSLVNVDIDMSLEAAIVVCIYEWSKIQNVNKGVIKRF